MKAYLPHGDKAYVARSKILDYLLSSTHQDGQSKALFFRRHGFTRSDWRILANALREVGVFNPVVQVVESRYGSRVRG